MSTWDPIAPRSARRVLRPAGAAQSRPYPARGSRDRALKGRRWLQAEGVEHGAREIDRSARGLDAAAAERARRRPADRERRGEQRLVEGLRVAEGDRGRLARRDVARHDEGRVVFVAGATQRGGEAAERFVVRVDRVIVEGPGAHPVVVLEAARVLAHLGERLGRAAGLDDAEVAVGRHRLQILGRGVPRRMAAAGVNDDEEAAGLVRFDPGRGLVEDARGRLVFEGIVRHEGVPSTIEPERSAGGRVRGEHRRRDAALPARLFDGHDAVGQAGSGIVEPVRALVAP